ncbi:MAG: MarR family winged helix-turn-helix transcriptional regulator [Bacteroidia bacterium]|jgi:DNA-binding MarR family transcriptional regulator
MRIEDQIKQSQFEDAYHKMVVNVMFTARFIELKFERIFKKHGLTSQQYNVLRILRGQYPKPICAGDVLSRMLDQSSNITRLMEKLLQKGLVERKINELNRRMHDISITPNGLAVLEKIAPDFNEVMIDYRKIAPEQAEIVSDLLDQFRG